MNKAYQNNGNINNIDIKKLLLHTTFNYCYLRMI